MIVLDWRHVEQRNCASENKPSRELRYHQFEVSSGLSFDYTISEKLIADLSDDQVSKKFIKDYTQQQLENYRNISGIYFDKRVLIAKRVGILIVEGILDKLKFICHLPLHIES
jgi:hypothetical protein